MNPIIDTIIEDKRWEGCCDSYALANAAVKAVLSNIETSWTGEVEISFLFCDDEKIRDLNAIWNDKDYATNVLSFPAAPNKIKTPVTLLGDVILAFDTISKEALEQDKTISSHAAHMLVHGVLHLFGYDHVNDIDADRMESVETRVLHTMGIADPWVSIDSSRS
jgi:probable rRNA maturation factor